ncbi:hypothetical protein R1sor_012008 [Riccia sorocarpa]|uniref:Uncharacterized protein n=1 Tax=Riccia sorocarpa TaxID=122646 RepID=A0ABD3I6I0_9MARC
MTDVFDSYVNLGNDPDVCPLVAGVDVDDFSIEKISGVAVSLTPDDGGPDFEEFLSDASDCKFSPTFSPWQMDRSNQAIIPSPPSSIPIDLTNDGLDDPFSPSRSQIVLVDALVDLTQYISSLENKGSKDQ